MTVVCLWLCTCLCARWPLSACILPLRSCLVVLSHSTSTSSFQAAIARVLWLRRVYSVCVQIRFVELSLLPNRIQSNDSVKARAVLCCCDCCFQVPEDCGCIHCLGEFCCFLHLFCTSSTTAACCQSATLTTTNTGFHLQQHNCFSYRHSCL